MLHSERTLCVIRSAVLIGAIAIPFQNAAAQGMDVAAPHKISTLGVGVTSLSASGSSSTGFSGYYTNSVKNFGMEAQVTAFSESGVTTYGSMVVAGFAFGPFLNPEAAGKNAAVNFLVGAGLWGSYSDAASSTDPMVAFTINAPVGPAMVRAGYGMIFTEGSNVNVLNLGLGFKFGHQ